MVIKLLSLGTAIKNMREKTMKKLLGISVMAMLAVSPMMANAAKTIGDLPTASADTNTNLVATTSYVKGAYNAVKTEHNKVVADMTVASGTYDHINAGNSVAENLVSLNTGVTQNDTKIGAIDNLTDSTTQANVDLWKNKAGTAQDHSDIVNAVQATKTQLNATDALVGDMNLTGFTNGSTVTGALQELKNANTTTNSKVVAVYSNWNSGGAPLRTAEDYVGLVEASSLQNVGITE